MMGEPSYSIIPMLLHEAYIVKEICGSNPNIDNVTCLLFQSCLGIAWRQELVIEFLLENGRDVRARHGAAWILTI
jgi:hypothetical protein